MAFRLTTLKSTWTYSSKTSLDCPFLIIRKKLKEAFEKIILENYHDFSEGKIHFEHFQRLSFFPSQGHNSINIGLKSTSRTIFGNEKTRAFMWDQYWWDFLLYCLRYKLLKFWPKLYFPYCKSLEWCQFIIYNAIVAPLSSSSDYCPHLVWASLSLST